MVYDNVHLVKLKTRLHSPSGGSGHESEEILQRQQLEEYLQRYLTLGTS
jgi:hypothetical protein